MKSPLILLVSLLPIYLLACDTQHEAQAESASTPDSICTTGCDNAALSEPVLMGSTGRGAVTTYGDVTNPQPSSGGACNYGSTQIQNFAAAFVHLAPGDNKGMWNAGHACGDCIRVRVGSAEGWRQVVVRIVDKCPDDFCGIDLGGAPAKALMGRAPGRYAGEWEWVSCTGQTGVSDGDRVLKVKEGSNAWWALVQVRNPPSAMQSMRWETRAGSGGQFSWASEAENFFKVPAALLQSQDTVRIIIQYRDASTDSLLLPGTSLGNANATITLAATP